jgi:translation initiation factor 5A
LKDGSYIVIDGEPCKVVEVEKSKPGKHGSAKVRLTGIAIFTGSKKTVIGTVDTHIEVPMIDKRAAQVISATPTSVQLMDLSSFEVTESPTPTEPEFQGKMLPGVEVEIWVVLGRAKVMRIKGTGS